MRSRCGSQGRRLSESESDLSRSPQDLAQCQAARIIRLQRNFDEGTDLPHKAGRKNRLPHHGSLTDSIRIRNQSRGNSQ